MILAENRKAYYNYKILEEYEAGIQLGGSEVKSVLTGKIDISSSYAVPKNNEMFLINAEIQPYQPNNMPADYDTARPRKLLLHKKEIKELIGKINTGLTLLVLKVYIKNGKIKTLLGLGRHLKKVDKREKIKKREVKRVIKRLVAGH